MASVRTSMWSRLEAWRSMSTEEPIDTTLPWARKREPVLTQVEYERRRHDALVAAQPPAGLMTVDYEPNRPAAPDAQSIIAKKGLKAPNEVEITTGDKVIAFIVCSCMVGIVGILLYLLVKLG